MASDNTNNSGSTPDTGNGTGATSISSHGGGNAAGGSAAPSPGLANGTGEPTVDTAMADVKSAHDAVAPKLGTPLTKVELKRLLKPRRKPLGLVARVIGLTADRSWLVPGGSTPGELLGKLTLFQALLMLLNEVTGFSTEVRDSVRVLESDLYRTALSICTIAEQSKAIDVVVTQTVAEMRKALALGPKQKHKVTKVAVKTVTVPVESPASASAASAGSPAGSGGGNTTPAPADGTSGSPTPPAPVPAPEPVATSNAGSSTPAAPTAPAAAPTGK